jgi:predicted GNAT family acetyltransferase
MTQQRLEILSTGALVDQFAEICIAQDRALLYENISTINKLVWQMKAVDDELRKRGREARLVLLKLYDHPNMQVRLHAAKCSLAVAPAAARHVIEAIARSGRMPQAADARGTLRNLKEGVFKPD